MNDFERYCKNRIKYGFFRFISLLLIACIVFFLSNELHLFSDRVYALETTTIYRNSSATTQGFLYTTSSSSTGTIYNGSVNTVISDASYGITFFINKGTAIGKVYKIQLNFNDYDYLSSNTSQDVIVSNGDTCSVVGYQNLNKGGSNNQSRTVEIMYSCTTPGSYVSFQFGRYIEGEGYKRITTVNWRINNLQWENIDDEQAQEIINNATTNTNNIINNQNTNTQEIIDNQNANTDKEIESQKVCFNYDYTNQPIGYLRNRLDSEGNLLPQSENSTNMVSDYLVVSKGKSYILTTNYSIDRLYCLYNNNKEFLSCGNEPQNGSIIITPNEDGYIRYDINSYYSVWKTTFEGEYCKNGNQAITDSVNDLNDTIKDTNVDTSSLNNVVGWLPPGPVDSILNLPLTLFNSLLNALNLACSSINLPLPFVEKNLELPCLGSLLRQIDGFWVWYETIGVMVAGIILYNYLLALYNWVDQTLSMRENTLPGYYEDRWGGGA